MPTLSIIMPVLDEAETIADTLDALGPLRRNGTQVIVVDGGSRDQTVRLAQPRADKVISAARGRAAQMNAGAQSAAGDVLVFLHVDTRLPQDAGRLVLEGLQRSGRAWGRFDVTIAGTSPLLTMVAWFMNVRSRLTGIATGDQAMFVTRKAFADVGGFPALPLMEDVALSARLKRVGRPLRLRSRAITSGRRWEKHGVLRTIVLMWRLRLAYYLGAEPAVLARRYGYGERND
jgi:rSAM/selenodomain-associated transferase 2